MEQTPAKGTKQEQSTEQFPTETQSEGKNFSPDKVVKAHETHSFNWGMFAVRQGMQCQGERVDETAAWGWCPLCNIKAKTYAYCIAV